MHCLEAVCDFEPKQFTSPNSKDRTTGPSGLNAVMKKGVAPYPSTDHATVVTSWDMLTITLRAKS